VTGKKGVGGGDDVLAVLLKKVVDDEYVGEHVRHWIAVIGFGFHLPLCRSVWRNASSTRTKYQRRLNLWK